MPSRTFAANKSSLFASSGTNLGGGADDHMPVGTWGSYSFRSAVRFANDFSGMKSVTKAVLRLRTSTQVHVGFSSSPDYVVRRCTADWTANGSSSSAEGGSGWGTSPTVYPGPASSDDPMYTSAAPTSENTWEEINITGIVRKWAPVGVGNGEGLPNYGVTLRPLASGDVTEFYSYRGAYPPEIVVDYTVDTAPVATPTGPTGTVTTLRPTITGTGTDVDGDAITSYGIEVRSGTTVVYSATTGSGASLSHVPTADLPPGALTVRLRATAAGATGSWSADRAFTVDRPPVMGAWSAPAASVAGTRRPVHTVAWSDPDGNAGQTYDIEVWTAPAGTAAVYSKLAQTAGLTASSVSHTPTADLPGGPLQARVRVKANNAWSPWSTWRAYTVVLTVPTLSWVIPDTDGGWAGDPYSMWADPTLPLSQIQFRGPHITYAPPSGTTLASANFKMEVVDAGIGGPVAGTVITNTAFTPVAAGGAYNMTFRPSTYAANWIAGTVKVTFTITAANSGQTIEVRHFRFALGDWSGAIALGDSVTGLGVSEQTVKGGEFAAILYRAQTSPTAAAPGATWGNITAVQALLPPTNAYLGIWSRLFRKADDPEAIIDGGFESGTLSAWAVTGTAITMATPGGAPEGEHYVIMNGDGVYQPTLAQTFPVLPGVTYRASALARSPNGSVCRLQVGTRSSTTGAYVNTGALVVDTTLAAFTYIEGYLTIPADGSIGSVTFMIRSNGINAANQLRWDAASFRGLLAGDAGVDKVVVNWSSLG